MPNRMDGKSKSLFKMMWRFKIEMPNRMDGKPKVLFNMLWRFFFEIRDA
jgi:hypothetical protein